jgi:hypothetical protein
MDHDASTLRNLLEELAQLPVRLHLSKQSAAKLSESFRDCRLELIRRKPFPLSEAQAHRLEQMDYRLQMVANGHAMAESIPAEARQALDVIGWSLPD